MKLIAIDSDVLVIYHIFRKDKRFDITQKFMDDSTISPKGITIYNLLELCGIIASAGKHREARKFFQEYCTKVDIQILFPRVSFKNEKEYWAIQNEELMHRIERGIRLGEAVILWAIETNKVDVFVTWNKKHFEAKTTVKVLTPDEFVGALPDRPP